MPHRHPGTSDDLRTERILWCHTSQVQLLSIKRPEKSTQILARVNLSPSPFKCPNPYSSRLLSPQGSGLRTSRSRFFQLSVSSPSSLLFTPPIALCIVYAYDLAMIILVKSEIICFTL